MKRLLLAIALLAAPAAASAQCNGTFPNNTVCGNITGSSNLPRPTSPSAFQGSAGGSNGQIQYNNGGTLAGATGGDVQMSGTTTLIQPLAVTSGKIADGAATNTKLAAGAANTVKGSINGTTTSDLAIASCSMAYRFTQWITGTGWSCGISPVLPSRTIAATLDLSAFSAITTQGYSTPGDGGGATFQKIAGNFIDTRALSGSITTNGTSGCTNGTYYGVDMDGGSGRGLLASVSVAGGVVTNIVPAFTSSAGYAAGDVLSIGSTVPGCTGSKTYTLATVTTPTGSFTDSAANKWQIDFPAAGLDARTMGVKFDWDGTDGTATDNFITLQNALSFAYYKTLTRVDLGGSIGGEVLLAKGTAMVGCSGTAALVSPYGVKVRGQGNYTSVIKFCNTFDNNTNEWELCDKTSHTACFGTLLEDFQIANALSVSGTSSRSVVYTNNAQHEAGMRRMVIIPGGCGRGATYETGYGGATYILLDSVEFKGGKTDANCGGSAGVQVYINYGTTQVIVKNLNVSGTSPGSGGPRQTGLGIDGGFVDIVGLHAEQVINPVTINIPVGLTAGQVRARSVVGGVDCVGLFTLISTNTPGNFLVGPPNALNGCTRLVTNGQPAGSNYTGPTLVDINFNP